MVENYVPKVRLYQSNLCTSEIKLFRLGTNHLTCRGGLWFFVLFKKFFSNNTRIRIFFCPPPKSEYFFQQHWESEYIFFEKTITPPLEVKWSVP